jgi:drug/metabolite transporter (DMT)-like permease
MHSLAHVNVAASVTIVDSYPALLALIGRFILGESYSVAQYLGSLVAFLGILGLSIVSYTGDLAPPGGNPVFGALLAFGGMVSVSAYFAIGKVMRAKYSTLEYTAVVYTIGALIAIPLTILANVSLASLTPKAWALIMLVALIPMLGGHTLINYVIGRLSLLATTVPILGEPVGATLLALLILGEPVSQEIAIFMALTLSGIAMVLVWEELRKQSPHTS